MKSAVWVAATPIAIPSRQIKSLKAVHYSSTNEQNSTHRRRYLVYRAAFKSQQNHHWGDGIWAPIADMKEAITHYDSHLNEVVASARCTDHIVVFSDPKGTTFRHDIYPDYKKSRHNPNNAKPILFSPLRKKLIESGEAEFYPNLEGDDVLGIMQTSRKNTVICTIDKDLKTIPGLHYNFDKKVHSEVTPQRPTGSS